MKICSKKPHYEWGQLLMKIKIRVCGGVILAIPIYPIVAPKNRIPHLPRGGKGLPISAGPRLRKAAREIKNPIFSTILFTECPPPGLINRIRTHLNCDCLGVIEFGVKNGWHIHIIHGRSIVAAQRILSNYGRVHSEPIRDIERAAWYITKSCGEIPPPDHPKSWYFCTRNLGRDEIFYIDAEIADLFCTGEWEIREFYYLAKFSITTLAHLKKFPPWGEP
jgi:hypothetical protein